MADDAAMLWILGMFDPPRRPGKASGPASRAPSMLGNKTQRPSSFLATPAFVGAGKNPGPGGSGGGCTNPVNLTADTLAGGTSEGQVLTVTPGTWEGATSFQRAWFRDGDIIIGQTADTYTVVAADVGTEITSIGAALNACGATLGPETNGITILLALQVEPAFANLSLLVGGTGTVGLQDMTDEAPTPLTLTWAGASVVSTAIADPWGGSTKLIKLDATADYIDTGSRTGFAWSTASADRTMEGWFYAVSMPNDMSLFDMRDSASAEEFSFYAKPDGSMRMVTWRSGGVNDSVGPGAGDGHFTIGAWHHALFQRKSDVLGLWLDGIFLEGVTQTLDPSFNSQDLQLGRNRFTTMGNRGYRTEMRCYTTAHQTNGTDFAVPLGPFPRS